MEALKMNNFRRLLITESHGSEPKRVRTLFFVSLPFIFQQIDNDNGNSDEKKINPYKAI